MRSRYHCNLHNDLVVRIEDSHGVLSLRREQENLENQIQSSPDNVQLYEREAEVRSKLLRQEEELRHLEQEYRPTPITEEDIARVVEMWTGIPVQRITETESEKLLSLEARLHQRVIGQDAAVSALARASAATRRLWQGKANRRPFFLSDRRRR